MNIWFYLLFISNIIIAIIFITTIFIIKYYPAQYLKLFKKVYNKPYFPKMALFIPCKGVTQQSEDHIRHFLTLCSKNISIYFIVEDTSDPAWSLIHSITSGINGVHL